MAFAGVSLMADGELCALTVPPIDAGADRGYHLLVGENYWGSIGRTPTGQCIQSRPFLVGGHRWHLDYYPNGFEEDDEGFISVFLALDDDVEGEEVKAHAVFSFIDQPELRMSTRVRESDIRSEYCDGQAKFMRRDVFERSRHLKSGSFIIRCDIHVLKTAADAIATAGAPTTDSFLDMPPSDLQSHLGDLLMSKEGADITFEVGGQTFAAHRCVLAARSTVFKELLFGGTTTTKTNVVEINDIKPKFFKVLLGFIYTDSFSDRDWLEDEEDDDEYDTWLLQLLEAADRYDLQRLKSICAEQLHEYIGKDTVADILVVAARRRCPLLKDSCVEYIKSHSSVYTVLTPESLDQIINTCSPSVLSELLFKFTP